MPVLQRSLKVNPAIGTGFTAEVTLAAWRLDGDPVTRVAGPPLTVPLTTRGETYTARVPDTSFLLGEEVDVVSYVAAALRDVRLESLTADLSLRCRSRGGQVLATAESSALLLPARPPGEREDGAGEMATHVRDRATTATGGIGAGGWFFVHPGRVAEGIAGLSPEKAAVWLYVLCLGTSLDAATPRPAPLDDALIERLGAEGKRAVAWVQKNWEDLTDVPVTFAEPDVVTIAGTLGVTGGTRKVTAKDFASLRVTAQWADADGAAATRTLSFDDHTELADDRAPFDFGQDPGLFREAISGQVVVSVRGLTGATLTSRSYDADDPALADLALTVPREQSDPFQPVPDEVCDPNLRLRGRVLTLGKACPSVQVSVLVQARADDEEPWRVVGAAVADANGNFSMPYPYGTFSSAQAVCSLAPEEKAAVPIVAESGPVTISHDFLWLAIRNPQAPDKPCGATADGGCPCGIGDSPSRVPDFAQVIGNDDYTQDLGSGCVNLSKPNRTINEFRYQAIVRTSDPDVATYALERHELALDAVDARLTQQVTATLESFRLSVLSERDGYDQSISAMSAKHWQGLDDCLREIVAGQRALRQVSGIVVDALAEARTRMDAVVGLVETLQADLVRLDFGTAGDHESVKTRARDMKELLTTAIDAAGTSVRYELRQATSVRDRPTVSLANPIDWQGAPDGDDLRSAPATSALATIGVATFALERSKFMSPYAPEPAAPQPPSVEFAQAVSVATGHILHYKVLFKADGYSLGDLVYSLPLAPGQKKQVVVYDAAQGLAAAERQEVSQSERLAAGLFDERDITNQLGGGIRETIGGQSRANTSGVSAGGGLAAGGSMGAFSAGGVIGVAGGTANSSSSASQSGSRDIAQFFGERLRQSIMQNAEGYRQLNASVVTTVQQDQAYGVTSEVVANHNHCHSLTMMYFEVLRHFAIYQELSSVEECLFVPLTLARFGVDNIAAWRDVLAPALLPMPSSTYLRPRALLPYGAVQHPLLPAFDAVKRISTHYANVDFPDGSYDEERIRFMKGQLRLRVNLPRPRTRYDRIMSLPVVLKEVQTDEVDIQATGKTFVVDSMLAGLTGGLSMLFTGAPGTNIEYKTTMIETKAQIFDAFMSMDANFQHVPPAQCIRVKRFEPLTLSFTVPWLSSLMNFPVSGADFFADGTNDKTQWELYARLLGYQDDSQGLGVYKLLNYYFKDRLISEWDTIFNNDIAPLIYDKLVEGLRLQEFSLDTSALARYTGGERVMTVNLTGRTSKTRAQLPEVIRLTEAHSSVVALKQYVTATVEDLRITYSTEHFNGTLYAGQVGNDLLDGVDLFIPVTAEEKRNPRREDRYLAATLVEHLNTHLEHYNKVLWADLDPDRRFMLLDGFDIQTYKADGSLPPGTSGMRSLASVVKNEMIGIAGNSLVMPVAPGYRVSQALVTQDGESETAALFDHYRPMTPVDPYRVSVPTRGVYTEALMGQCNACEKIEPDRAQDWTVFTTDEPTPIQQVPLTVPSTQDWRAVWRDFAAPMINVQNAPTLPQPGVGLGDLSALLGKGDAFRDVTGLAGNQNNALQTYLSNQANAKAFADMASEMAKQSHNTANSTRIMGAIESARSSGALSDTDANSLVKQHLQGQIDGGASQKAASDQSAKQTATPLSQAAVKAAEAGKDVKATRTDTEGNAETLDVTSGGSSHVIAEVSRTVRPLKQDSSMACWATVAAMLVNWKQGRTDVTPEQAVLPAGEKYVDLLAANTGLPATDKDDFILRMRMASEPLASYPLSTYAGLIEDYGPLWVTTDAAPDARFSPHARVLIKITGKDVNDPNAVLTFINPATGLQESEPFGDFVKAFEAMATDNRSRTLMPQVVHFADKLTASEGYQVRLDGPVSVHEPVHELISMAALQRSTVAVPSTTKLGKDLPVNEFLRGVLFNDDPALLFFDEDRTTNWNFSTGISWGAKFVAAEHASAVDLKNIIGRSHFFDLQFLHGMAARAGELPEETRAKVMLWCEVMYRLSVGDGIVPSDAIGAAAPSTSYTDPGGATHTFTMGTFFTPATEPNGGTTFTNLFGQGTKFPGFDVKRRAIGSVLHLVQDSYARGHVKRTLANPGDLAAPPSIDSFKPGTFGHWTEIENFHDYRSQKHADHDKYDKVATLPDPARIDTYNPILGARDAVAASTAVLDHWHAGDPWATARPTIAALFTLSPTATPADGTV